MKFLKAVFISLVLLVPVQVFAMGEDDPMLTYVLIDELGSNGTETEWNINAWIGRDLNKLYFKSEGIYTAGAVEEQEYQLLYSHAVSPYWDMQMGLRVDSFAAGTRNYLAFGYMGTAPYFIDSDIGLFYGDNGQMSLRVDLEYELMFTQRLVLISEYSMNIYSQDDAAVEIGSGLSNQTLGFKLAYEIKREFAPYIGVSFNKYYGNTASYVVGGGGEASSTEVMLGIHAWF